MNPAGPLPDNSLPLSPLLLRHSYNGMIRMIGRKGELALGSGCASGRGGGRERSRAEVYMDR